MKMKIFYFIKILNDVYLNLNKNIFINTIYKV